MMVWSGCCAAARLREVRGRDLVPARKDGRSSFRDGVWGTFVMLSLFIGVITM